MLRVALHLGQQQDLGKEVELFLEQALIAVRKIGGWGGGRAGGQGRGKVRRRDGEGRAVPGAGTHCGEQQKGGQGAGKRRGRSRGGREGEGGEGWSCRSHSVR